MVDSRMKDVAGLMHLAFKLAHEISDASLDMESAPGLRPHRFYATQVADCGVSTLTHIAAASADLSDSSFNGRMRVAASLHGAREELSRLKQALKTIGVQRYADTAFLVARVDELSVVIMALTIEVRGNRLVA